MYIEQGKQKSFVLQTAPLLNSESTDEFEKLRANLKDEIKPQGPIEEMYVDELAYICWEILRLRHAKVILIDIGSRRALEHLLEKIEANSTLDDIGDDPEDVSWLYFRNASVQQEIRTILQRFQLDESAISAQAMHDALPSLELIERMLESLERRRDRILLFVAKYGKTLAQRMRQSADRTLASENVRQLQDRSLVKITP